MKSRTSIYIAAIGLLVVLASPDWLFAQQTPYRLIDLGTFGGPSSGTQEELKIINDQGMVAGGADTSIPNHPNSCLFCGSAFITHAFEWKNGALRDLRALSGDNSSGANWISENGLSAGLSETVAMDPLLGIRGMHGVLWKNGQIIDLGTLEGGYESIAFSVNSRGQVAGISQNLVPDPFTPLGTQQRTFLWQNGVMQDLGTLGGPDAGLVGFKGNVEINERGQVVACSYINSTPNPATGLPTAEPFLWENGKMLDLGSFGGTSGCAVNLNSRGQVAGYSNLPGDIGMHPFLWDRGVLKDLGTLGGDNGFANSINDAGDVAGQDDLAGGAGTHAFLWKDGVMTDLGALPGDDFSMPVGINSKSQVVGFSASSADIHAVLWENGTIVDLNTLVPSTSALDLLFALDINDRGEIVGFGVLPNGDGRASLLVPCEHDAQSCGNEVASANAARRNSTLTAAQRVAIHRFVAESRTRFSQHYHVRGIRAPND